jgi:hypothetical protein
LPASGLAFFIPPGEVQKMKFCTRKFRNLNLWYSLKSTRQPSENKDSLGLSMTYHYFLSNAQIGTFFAYIKVSAAKRVGSKKKS